MRKFSAVGAPLWLLAYLTVLAASAQEADYDRLDGTGASGKTVQVIEWGDNLEVHVYPVGSLKGLALKIDDRTKGKKVMVIGYRFDNDPGHQLVRRAILGNALHGGFRAFRDNSVRDFDKVVITNHAKIDGRPVAFRLDPEPTQLYPDGYSAPNTSVAQKKPTSNGTRAPANDSPAKAARDGLNPDDPANADGYYSVDH